jgi:hypothetical protein
MPITPTTAEIQKKLNQLFPQEQRAAAIALLEAECGSHLPLIESQGADGILRVRCAALKLSEGSLEKLHTAVRVANQDWRDVLVAAGFGHSVREHLRWLES